MRFHMLTADSLSDSISSRARCYPSFHFSYGVENQEHKENERLFLSSISKVIWIGHILISSKPPWCSLCRNDAKIKTHHSSDSPSITGGG